MTLLNPGAVDLVKLLAMLAMLLDHFNTLFLSPLRPELYALGRAAFPLFSLIWAINVNRKPERLQFQANRLWLWAVVTQPVFMLAFRQLDPWYALNILFVFAGTTQLLAWHRQSGTCGLAAGTALLAVLAWPLSPASYGLQGEILTVGLAVIAGSASAQVRYCAGWAVFLSLVTLNGASHLATMPVATLVFATLPTCLFPLDGRDCRTAAHGGQTPALASGPVLLSGLCGASPARRNDSVFCLNRRGLPVLYRPDKPLKRRSDAKR